MKLIQKIFLLSLLVISCNPKKSSDNNSDDKNNQDSLSVRYVKLDTTRQKDTLGFNIFTKEVEPLPLPILDEVPALEGFDISSETQSEILIEPKVDTILGDSLIPMADAPLNEYPFNIAGKIQIEFGDGRIFSCSCQFVAKYILMTAAHCIKMNGLEAKKITFMLKYNNGSSDKIFVVEDMIYWSSYKNVGSYDDYAFLKINKNNEVPNYWLGIASAPTSRRTNSMGYPSNIKDGSVLQNISGYTDGRIPYGQYYYMTENPFGPGSSGGAWFNEDGYVVGINSFGVRGTPNTMFSSYLGKDNLVFNLFEEAKKRF